MVWLRDKAIKHIAWTIYIFLFSFFHDLQMLTSFQRYCVPNHLSQMFDLDLTYRSLWWGFRFNLFNNFLYFFITFLAILAVWAWLRTFFILLLNYSHSLNLLAQWLLKWGLKTTAWLNRRGLNITINVFVFLGEKLFICFLPLRISFRFRCVFLIRHSWMRTKKRPLRWFLNKV